MGLPEEGFTVTLVPSNLKALLPASVLDALPTPIWVLVKAAASLELLKNNEVSKSND